MGLALLSLITSCGGGGGGGGSTTTATLVSVEVTPATTSVAAGLTEKFTATGTYTDGSTQDISTSVTWLTINSIATIDATGLATGVAEGMMVTITAFYDSTIEGTADLTVTAAVLTAVQVTPAITSIAVGTTQQYTATANYSDGTTTDVTGSAAWTSGGAGFASIDTSSGLATGLSGGTETLSATFDSVVGTADLTVTAASLTSIQVTPAIQSIAAGVSQQYTATGIYDDDSTQDLTTTVTWSSDNVNITIDSSGLTTGGTAGDSATITATFGIPGTASLTVTDATLNSILVSPDAETLAAGTTQQLTATGKYSDASTRDLTDSVTWFSPNIGVATVDVTGLVTSVAEGGPIVITATQSTISDSADITVTAATLNFIDVTPASPSIAAGTTQQFIATGIYSDFSTQDLSASVDWVSSDTTAATIDATGLATGVTAGGLTTISATFDSVSGSTDLTVTTAVLNSIAVTPVSPSIEAGTAQQFTATGTYSDASTQDLSSIAAWISDDTATATIDSTGLATGVTGNVNPVTITATFDGESGTASLTVDPALTLDFITVTPTSDTVPKGRTVQMIAIGTYSDTSTKDLTEAVAWTSDNTTAITVDFSGLATSEDVSGSAGITATFGSEISNVAVLTAAPAELDSIEVTPILPGVPAGTDQQFFATGVYSDGSTLDHTGVATWVITDTGSTGSTMDSSIDGLFLAGDFEGAVTLTASFNGVDGSVDFDVTVAIIISIDVESILSPAPATVGVGSTLQFIAYADYSDSSRQDVTGLVIWSSFDIAIATVDAAGLATGVTVGPVDIHRDFW